MAKSSTATTLLSFIFIILLYLIMTVIFANFSFALNRYPNCISEAANNYGPLMLYHLIKCYDEGFLGSSSQESIISENAIFNGNPVFSNLLSRNLDINNHTVYIATSVGNSVQLSAIHTQPQVVHVGNFFHISVIIFNNSPNTIRFIAGPCDSALSAKFDKNIVVKHGIGCLLVAHLINLKPGEMATTIGPSIGTTYQAATSGRTNATVTFHYQLENAVNANVTKSFVFDIT